MRIPRVAAQRYGIGRLPGKKRSAMKSKKSGEWSGLVGDPWYKRQEDTAQAGQARPQARQEDKTDRQEPNWSSLSGGEKRDSSMGLSASEGSGGNRMA